MDSFSPATRLWFRRNFDAPTDAQALGWPIIARGHHVLITAPTGSGKTLAAFLWAIDRLMAEAGDRRDGAPRAGDRSGRAGLVGTRVLYLSPLKALVVDIERNLRAPLAGIARAAEAAEPAASCSPPRVAVRTGDTPARERQRQLREPAEILVTTPESLYLMLGSSAAENLASVDTVIVDEVHALAATKRGAHLTLSLERLSALVSASGRRDPQRIGLSATVQPLAEAARWLGGDRPVDIVDAATAPKLDLRVSVPVPNMERPVAPGSRDRVDGSSGQLPSDSEPGGGPILGELYRREQQYPSENRLAEKGLWSALYPALLTEIMAHRSTIIFVNSRGLCERLAQRLNELAAETEIAAGRGAECASAAATCTARARQANDHGNPLPWRMNGSQPSLGCESDVDERAVPELVRAHHGSVSQRQRTEIEEALKQGRLKAIVATSSLEMGIDMGAVDQVLLVESPGSVARGLQRVGRAGHGVGEVSTGRIFPKYRGDLLECAVIAGRMREGVLEPLRMPSNALDVLAQQLVAHCISAPRRVDELLGLVTRAGPYRGLSRAALESVLEMLAGSYRSSDFADLRPLLSWDRAADVLSPRRGAPMVSRLNAGTIPDRGLYGVHLGSEGPRIGELDEEMVFETRAGECILLGASTWRVEEISRDRVIVSPAPGEPGKLPFWRGDGPGRPVALGRAVGAFCRELAAVLNGTGGAVGGGVGATAKARAAAWIRERTPLDPMAAENLAAYIQDQREATGEVPSDRTIVVERFRDELGDWRVCILTPFGAPVHGPWAMALQWQLERREGFEIQVMYTDDGIVLRLADGDALPELTELLPDPDEIEDRVTEQLADTALFASLFRENAARALLLPRRSAKGRQPLWAQRLKAQNLLAVVRRYPAFPILLETYRQALRDQFDLPGLKEVLSGVRSRAIRVHVVETRSASPFARSLVFAYVAAYIYEQDAPIAERRAQALTLDRGLLAELLGESELRALIDPEVLEALERELQHLGPMGAVAVGPSGADAVQPDVAGFDSEGAHGDASGDGGVVGGITTNSGKASDRGARRVAIPDRRARDADELHDLLRRLGDLTPSEVNERCRSHGDSDGLAWLDALRRQRRAVQIRVAGESRWIAAEDSALYRDALGVVPPSGLPDSFLAVSEAPLERLLRRFARTRGPFTTPEPALRFGLRAAQLEPVLSLLEQRGELVRGEIRPNGSGPEWCDAEVLRQLRRRTLARARDQVAPVDGATLGRFLPAWQGVGDARRGTDRLLDVLAQLEGLIVTWSQLDQVLLPARVPGYRTEDLDLLAASGQVLWVGRGAAGPKDGRIALYRPENAAVMLGDAKACEPVDDPPVAGAEVGPDSAANGRGVAGQAMGAEPDKDAEAIHSSAIGDCIVAHLRRRGACFLFELQQVVERRFVGAETGVDRAAFESAIWDLVWAGRITNDTFAPLRSLRTSRREQGGSRRFSRRSPRFGASRHIGASGGIRGGRGGVSAGGLGGGRWSLVEDLAGVEIEPFPEPEDQPNGAIAPLQSSSGFGRAGPGSAADGAALAGDPAASPLNAHKEQNAARILAAQRLLLQVQMLLERYGLVSREVIAAEGLSGGFGPYYKVLKELEEAGRVRRGYFVEGLSGAQFALPATVERLRAARSDEVPVDGFGDADVCILSAIDPANPYGALLNWPESGLTDQQPSGADRRLVANQNRDGVSQQRAAATRRPGVPDNEKTAVNSAPKAASASTPKRLAGAWVILVAGKPVLYLTASGKHLLTFPDSITDEGHELIPALAALPRVPSAGRKRRLIQHIDGIPALESPLREALLAAGFEVDHDALVPARFRPDAPSPRRRTGPGARD